MNLFSLSSNRRVLVIDPGNRSVKALLAWRRDGRVQVTDHRRIDLPDRHPVAPGSIESIETLLKEFAAVPIAISLPQQLSISQVIDLPKVEQKQIKSLIEEETAKFGGLTEGRLVYDYGKLNSFGKFQNPYWVTFAKENEILNEASRLPGVGERLCEIITPANALIAAFHSLPSRTENALLVELGEASTVVALVAQGQPVYAIHYPMGGDAFSDFPESNGRGVPAQRSETKVLSSEEFGHPNLRAAVDAWRFELEKILRDWLRENPELNLSPESFRVFLSGDATRLPGMINYLRSTSHLDFKEWPDFPHSGINLPLDRYAIPYGIALKSLGLSHPSASLFPPDLREVRKRRHSQELLQNANWILLLAVALLLLFGTWQKLNLVRKKNELIKHSQAILQEARQVELLRNRWEEAYEQLRPVLKQQQRTLDALEALRELRKVRGDKKLWFVLFADQKSYFSGQTLPQPGLEIVSEFAVFTNVPPTEKHGFIAELSLAESGEGMRQTLSKVVTELKGNRRFTNVDTLSFDQRKHLVNTNVIIPERYFALSIELTNAFENPLPKARMARRDSPVSHRVFHPVNARGAVATNGRD